MRPELVTSFEDEKRLDIARLSADAELRSASVNWMARASRARYSYHFTWMGRPIIQFPQDIIAMQELIWASRPQLIVETGVAHGGSVVFYASMLELLGEGRVVGIDVDIRPPNRSALESHPMAHRITLLEGSSTDPAVAHQVRDLAAGCERVMVVLDSNHTHEHVLQELRLYGELVTRGSWLVVFDTVIEDLPPDFFPDRPWGPGNNPRTAIAEFLRENDRFAVDEQMDGKLLITVASGGYLRCIKD